MAPLREAAASVVERGREQVAMIRLNCPERRRLKSEQSKISW
jgi:hypothetical protein